MELSYKWQSIDLSNKLYKIYINMNKCAIIIFFFTTLEYLFFYWDECLDL